MAAPNIRQLDSFHNATRSIIFAAQFFALMPIDGMWSTDVHYLQFKWFSWRLVYSLVLIIGSVINALLYFRILFHVDSDIGLTGTGHSFWLNKKKSLIVECYYYQAFPYITQYPQWSLFYCLYLPTIGRM